MKALALPALVFSFSLLAGPPPVIDVANHAASRYGRTVAERVDQLSARFVGQKYVADPLGEGPEGEVDKDPLYRFDAFDCTTFVETVLALSHSDSRMAFERTMNRIRYRTGQPEFTARNHFPDADWRPHLIKLGILKDITAQVAGTIPLKEAHARINKAKWFAQRLPASAAKPADAGVVDVSVPYLPFDRFFVKKDNGYAVPSELLARIPSGTVFNIVRTRFNPSDKVGTELSIWHQGFLIRRGGELMVRHATHLGAGRVAETPAVDFLLAEYLRKVNVRSKDHGLNFLGLASPEAN